MIPVYIEYVLVLYKATYNDNRAITGVDGSYV